MSPIRLRLVSDRDPNFDAAPLWAEVYVNVPQVSHLFGTLYAAYDLAQRPGQITTPALIALGRYDYSVPYIQWDERKDALPHHTYALFDQSGHTPPFEESARFDQLLVEWARRYAPTVRSLSLGYAPLFSNDASVRTDAPMNYIMSRECRIVCPSTRQTATVSIR